MKNEEDRIQKTEYRMKKTEYRTQEAVSSSSVYCILSSGFTLLEVIIATAILMVVMGAVIQLFVSHLRASHATQNYLLVSEHNERALQKMAEELRGTDSEFVNVSFSGSQGTRTLPPLTPTGSPKTVTLYSSVTFKRITGFDIGNGAQTWSDNITFQLNTTTNKVERVEGANTEVLASHAEALSFYNAPGCIGVILKTSLGDPTGTRGTRAEVENRIEIYPLNCGTD